MFEIMASSYFFGLVLCLIVVMLASSVAWLVSGMIVCLIEEQERKSIMKDEKVLVVKQSYIESIGLAEGYVVDSEDVSVDTILRRLFMRGDLEYMDRIEAEEDNDYRQIITFLTLRCENVYVGHWRSVGGVEQRLAGKYTIGFGGHLNPIDGPPQLFSSYYSGALRELHEETGRHLTIDRDTVTGIINDRRDSVGRVHLGIVHVMEISKDAVDFLIGESELNVEPMTKFNLAMNWTKMNRWSHLILESEGVNRE